MAIDKLDHIVRPNVVQSRTDQRRKKKPKQKRQKPGKDDKAGIDEFA